MPELILREPTSVFLGGTDRPLLNWVAYAFASSTDPGFRWTDVRLRGEELDPTDPLADDTIPEERIRVVNSNDLTRNDAVANMALAGVIRSDEPPENVRRLVDFLRLPTQTQERLAATRRSGRPSVLVLSNAHRMVALYPTDTVGPAVRAIVESGAILFVTFADSPPAGRLAFDTIVHVEGGDAKSWRTATLRVEKAPPGGTLEVGVRYPLPELVSVAHLLQKRFP